MVTFFCPYNHKKEIQVSQSGFSYNDDNLNDVSGGTVVVTFEPMECPKEGCAVWYGGRCHYYSE